MGPAVALAGVFIRTGNLLNTGERVLSGLMQRFDSQYLVFDNAGCFSQGPMPAIGNHFTFGTFDVYVAIAQPFVYPKWCTWQKIHPVISRLTADVSLAP